jgi:MerR family mercuric resistance operon transcriptional regulator
MLSIGALAKATGETVKTLRFWTDQNLLLAERGENLYRYYRAENLERISFIRSAQALGFSLNEIGSILELKEKDILPCDEVRARLQVHLGTVQHRIVQLQRLATDLQARLDWTSSHPEASCDGEGCVYLS